MRCGSIENTTLEKFQCSSASRKFLNQPPRVLNIRAPADVSVLFSEPKIPQSAGLDLRTALRLAFQCSSASRKFLNSSPILSKIFFSSNGFSALQRAENSSIDVRRLPSLRAARVSVLFSEPKIPQFVNVDALLADWAGFSALQRAENSSIVPTAHASLYDARRFSALQRAENSSIDPELDAPLRVSRCFSALQRAENSSIRRGALEPINDSVRFQCSSASRKFLNQRDGGAVGDPRRQVSVLFSEPKIPQFPSARILRRLCEGFSALQRAENSSIPVAAILCKYAARFQCSSASRKFLNPVLLLRQRSIAARFSALQRAENSSIVNAGVRRRLNVEFQCSSASRKFLNQHIISNRLHKPPRRFSALQRAENSSIEAVRSRVAGLTRFSALQRAENSSIAPPVFLCSSCVSFSALQRAENSSIPQSRVQC